MEFYILIFGIILGILFKILYDAEPSHTVNPLAFLQEITRLHEELDRMRHRVEKDKAAIRAVLENPYGCPFCDCGKLRKPDDPSKGHDEDCPYILLKHASEEE